MFRITRPRLRTIAATGLLSAALLGGASGIALADSTPVTHDIVLEPGQEAYMPTWWLGGTRLCMENLSAGPASVDVFAGFSHWHHVWNPSDRDYNPEACWTTSYFGARADVVNHSETPGTQLAVYEPDGPSPVHS